jgi:hypothetical protein
MYVNNNMYGMYFYYNIIIICMYHNIYVYLLVSRSEWVTILITGTYIHGMLVYYAIEVCK